MIAGGGPTGVEVSGMFAEMSKSIISKEYAELAGLNTKNYLIDGGTALLKPMSAQSQQYTYDALTKMGVIVKLGVHVKDYTGDKVHLDSGEVLESKTLIWAAGVSAKKIDGLPDNLYNNKTNRLMVDEYNMVKGTNNLYAIGDTCIQTTDQKFPHGHPQVAQVAIRQGKNLAKNFILMAKGLDIHLFEYVDKGLMAIIGKNLSGGRPVQTEDPFFGVRGVAHVAVYPPGIAG